SPCPANPARWGRAALVLSACATLRGVGIPSRSWLPAARQPPWRTDARVVLRERTPCSECRLPGTRAWPAGSLPQGKIVAAAEVEPDITRFVRRRGADVLPPGIVRVAVEGPVPQDLVLEPDLVGRGHVVAQTVVLERGLALDGGQERRLGDGLGGLLARPPQ